MTLPGLVTLREATRTIADQHALSRPRVTRLLATGVAGEPVRAGKSVLYAADRVRAVADRRVVSDSELAALGLSGVVVARRVVDLTTPPETQRGRLAEAWDLNLWHCLFLEALIDRHGPMPVLATISGFVLMGADLTGFDGSRTHPARVRMCLREPGPWYGSLRDARLPSGSGPAFWFRELRGLALRRTAA